MSLIYVQEMKWQGWSLYDDIFAVLNKTMLFLLYRE